MDCVLFETDICDTDNNVVFEASRKYRILSEECGKLYVSHGNKNKNECSVIPFDMQGIKLFSEGAW